MYRVQLQNFEGPLDLLLFFIKRDELDIYDIPIAYITDQFIEYLHFMEQLDLGVAAEFIYMASTLMSIKARMMLPREAAEPDTEFDEADPRYELVQSLLEYKRFKEMGGLMRDLDDAERRRYRRGQHLNDQVGRPDDSQELLKELTLYDLIAAWHQVMNRSSKPPVVHMVETVKTSVEEQGALILARIRTTGRAYFPDLIRDATSRMVVVVMFLAILELVKEGRLVLFVDESLTDFHLDLPTVSETLNA